MDKLTMAHEYALKMLENLNPMQMEKPTRDGIVYECFELADAMQAEADKREVSIAELMKDHVHDYIYGRVCACGAVNGAEKEWQPDWSVAPEWASWWTYREKDDVGIFWSIPPVKTNLGFVVVGDHKSKLSTMYRFGYQGNWQDSLRMRPQ